MRQNVKGEEIQADLLLDGVGSKTRKRERKSELIDKEESKVLYVTRASIDVHLVRSTYFMCWNHGTC